MRLTRLMRLRSVAVPLALLATILAPASSASAHSASPWFGTYQVSVVGGSQDTTWTLDHVPTSGCDVSATGQGSDDQDFLSGSPQTVQFSGVGSTAFPATIMGLALNYTENREGSITEGQPTTANTEECPASGGGEVTPITPDCGTRSLSTSVDVDPSPTSPSIARARARAWRTNRRTRTARSPARSFRRLPRRLWRRCRRSGRRSTGACPPAGRRCRRPNRSQNRMSPARPR